MNKELKNIETFITDFDDTLVPLRKAYVKYAANLMKAIAKNSGLKPEEIAAGFNEIYAEHKNFQLEDVINSHRPLKEKFPGEDLEKKFAKEIKVAREVHKKAIQPHEGTAEMLQNLKKQGIKLVMYTAGPASYTVEKLEQAGLANIFDKIYAVRDSRPETSEDVRTKHKSGEWDRLILVDEYPKNDSKTFMRIINDIHPENPEKAVKNTVMVGDSPNHDIAMAKRVGAKTIHVTGYRDEDISSPDTKLVISIFSGGAVKKEDEKKSKDKSESSQWTKKKLGPDVTVEKAPEITKYISGKARTLNLHKSRESR